MCGWFGGPFAARSSVNRQPARGGRSIERGRFLFRCFATRVRYRTGFPVRMSSPRLGSVYRQVMSDRWVYFTIEFDRLSRQRDLVLGLQHLGLANDARWTG